MDIDFNHVALDHFLHGEDGPVMRHIAEIAQRVTDRARYYATGATVSGYGASRGPMVRTGRLRSSITYALDRDSQGPYADVGTNVEYAPFLELGTGRMRPYPFLRPALDDITGNRGSRT